MKLLKFRRHCQTIVLLLLLTLVLLQQVCSSFPIPKVPGWPTEADRTKQVEPVQQQPPDKCKGQNKGRICEVICKNNPAEGGILCNCDRYALRGTRPSYTDCNRLI